LGLPKKKEPQPKNLTTEMSQQPESSPERISKRDLVFDIRFLEDLTYWVKTDRKIALRLMSLVEEIGRTPFSGIGKPERLKYQDGNVWSRRVTDKDRIVYLVTADRIDFLQARYHYGDR
jgi:toxin YoeB